MKDHNWYLHVALPVAFFSRNVY